MACEDIEERLQALRAQKRSLELAMDSITGQELLARKKELAQLMGQIATEQVNLENCRKIAAPHPVVPFVGRVQEIFCAEARKKESGKQEPYLVITSVDMLRTVQVGPIPVTIPTFHCVLVCPWSGVEPGTWHRATELPSRLQPAFWNLSGQAQKVTAPQDVIFVVGLFEHDSSSPEAIRLALETGLEATLIGNIGLEHPALAATMVNDVIGIFDTARIVAMESAAAPLYPDDRLGVRQLTLSAYDLDTINALGTLEKSITFTHTKDGKITDEYRVTFSFEK